MADWVIYDAGAAAATQVQRLALLVSGVVADFRKAVAFAKWLRGRVLRPVSEGGQMLLQLTT